MGLSPECKQLARVRIAIQAKDTDDEFLMLSMLDLL